MNTKTQSISVSTIHSSAIRITISITIYLFLCFCNSLQQILYTDKLECYTLLVLLMPIDPLHSLCRPITPMRPIISLYTLKRKVDNLTITKDPTFKRIVFSTDRLNDLPTSSLNPGMPGVILILICLSEYDLVEPFWHSHSKAELLASFQDLGLLDEWLRKINSEEVCVKDVLAALYYTVELVRKAPVDRVELNPLGDRLLHRQGSKVVCYIVNRLFCSFFERRWLFGG